MGGRAEQLDDVAEQLRLLCGRRNIPHASEIAGGIETTAAVERRASEQMMPTKKNTAIHADTDRRCDDGGIEEDGRPPYECECYKFTTLEQNNSTDQSRR